MLCGMALPQGFVRRFDASPEVRAGGGKGGGKGGIAQGEDLCGQPGGVASATVATGKPGGICTVASRASMPPSEEAVTGMPITGFVVRAATAPARWAAMPAAQMKTSQPSASSRSTRAAVRSGVRWADVTVKQ